MSALTQIRSMVFVFGRRSCQFGREIFADVLLDRVGLLSDEGNLEVAMIPILLRLHQFTSLSVFSTSLLDCARVHVAEYYLDLDYIETL